MRAPCAALALAPFVAHAQMAPVDEPPPPAAPEAPEASAPPSLCEPLKQLIAAADDGFAHLRGEQMPKGVNLFKSTASLPDATCFVDGANEAEGTMKLQCVQKPPKELSIDEAVALMDARAAEVQACLDASSWKRSKATLGKETFEQAEPYQARVEVDLLRKPKLAVKTVVAIARAPQLASQQFCDTLGVLVGGVADRWKSLPDGTTLPGAQKCATATFDDKPGVRCLLTAVEDRYVGLGWLRRGADAVGACMQGTPWRGKPTWNTAEFTHPDPAAPKVSVSMADLSYQSEDVRKKLHLASYTVTIDFVAP